jgi:hypothetical protein
MSELLEINRWEVKNVKTGSRLEIISSDASTSYGTLADFIVCDELTHWRTDALWVSLFSAAAKKRHCVLMVIGNAGFLDDWTYKVRESVRTDSAWYFSRLEGPVASWISPELLDEQRRILPPTAFARLWKNLWSANSGDALDEKDISAAFKHDAPMTGEETEWAFCAGLDIGISRDASAFVVLGKKHERFRLAHIEIWKPLPGQRVDLEHVENGILAAHRRFRIRLLGYDPWNCEYLSSRLAKAHVPVQQLTFSGSNLNAMATAVIDGFIARSVELYDRGSESQQLRADLRRLRVKETPAGMRLVSPRGMTTGHGDLATALAVGLVTAKEVICKTRKIGVW